MPKRQVHDADAERILVVDGELDGAQHVARPPLPVAVEHLEADQTHVRGNADEPAADEPGDVRAVAVGVRRRDPSYAASGEIIKSGNAVCEVRRRVQTRIDDGHADGTSAVVCSPAPAHCVESMPKPVDLDCESPNITGADTVEPGEARSIGDSPRSSVTPSVSKNGVACGAGILGFRGRRSLRGRPVLPGARRVSVDERVLRDRQHRRERLHRGEVVAVDFGAHRVDRRMLRRDPISMQLERQGHPGPVSALRPDDDFLCRASFPDGLRERFIEL